ncbi:MAG TPA: polysaccharide biosynthesis C-terminal domain-containing protein [Sphingobacteriaceae bacterium]|nr:polysaccharide biosynthesis C-terminal domain-containing protein [Sphingobacteriaceae bacterium]
MSLIRKLASQTAIYGLSSIVGRLINYLLVPLYVRTLSLYDNGVLTDFYAAVTFLLIIYTYGMETTFFRFANKDELNEKDVYKTSLWCVIISSGLISFLLIIFSSPIATWMMYPAHPEYVIYFAIILGIDAVTSIPFVRLRQQHRPIKFVTGKLLNIGVNVLINLFFLVACPWLLKNQPDSFLLKFYNPEIGVGYVFIANLIASIVTMLFLLPEFASSGGKFVKSVMEKMLQYSFPLMFAGLAGMTNESFSRVILKYELPYSMTENIKQLGIFGQCFKLAIFMSLAIQTFRMASEPFFFSTSKNLDAKLVYARIMNYFVIVCCMIFLGVTLYLDILKHLLQPAYFEGLVIVPILLLAYLFLGIFQNLTIWFKLGDKTSYGIYFAVFGAVITIALNYALIPAYGYVGSAIATLICYFLMAISCYIVGQKYYEVPYNLKRISGYIILSIALYATGNYIRLHIFHAGSIIWFLVMATLIGIFVCIAWIIERNDLKNVKSISN